MENESLDRAIMGLFERNCASLKSGLDVRVNSPECLKWKREHDNVCAGCEHQPACSEWIRRCIDWLGMKFIEMGADPDAIERSKRKTDKIP